MKEQKETSLLDVMRKIEEIYDLLGTDSYDHFMAHESASGMMAKRWVNLGSRMHGAIVKVGNDDGYIIRVNSKNSFTIRKDPARGKSKYTNRDIMEHTAYSLKLREVA